MSCNTCARIKGFVNHEEIFDFIKQKYDVNAVDYIREHDIYDFELKGSYIINEHSEIKNRYCPIKGYIDFIYNGEKRSLFYNYDNINFLENYDYYSTYGLSDMVESETTYVSLRRWGSSVEIIREIVIKFGGGWMNEDDRYDELYKLIKS